MFAMRRENEKFLEACKEGRLDIVDRYLTLRLRSGLNFNRFAFRKGSRLAAVNDNANYTSLHYAALGGHKDVVSRLLAADNTLPLHVNKDGCVPLHLGCWGGHREVVQLLLAHDSARRTVNTENNRRETPLYYAAQFGHAHVANLLLQHGADPSIPNEVGETPLDLACRYGRIEVARLLLTTCPDLALPAHAVDHLGRTILPPFSPLHLAARHGKADAVQLLLDVGYDVDFLAETGTALHDATRFGRLEVIALLLNNGADSNVRNAEGQTVLDILNHERSARTKEMTRLLQSRREWDAVERMIQKYTPNDANANTTVSTLGSSRGSKKRSARRRDDVASDDGGAGGGIYENRPDPIGSSGGEDGVWMKLPESVKETAGVKSSSSAANGSVFGAGKMNGMNDRVMLQPPQIITSTHTRHGSTGGSNGVVGSMADRSLASASPSPGSSASWVTACSTMGGQPSPYADVNKKTKPPRNMPQNTCTYQAPLAGYEFVPPNAALLMSYDNVPPTAKGLPCYDNVPTSQLQYDNAPPDHHHWTHECPSEQDGRSCGSQVSHHRKTRSSSINNLSISPSDPAALSNHRRQPSSPMFDSGIGINSSSSQQDTPTPDLGAAGPRTPERKQRRSDKSTNLVDGVESEKAPKGNEVQSVQQAGSVKLMTFTGGSGGSAPSPLCTCTTGSYDNVPKGAAVLEGRMEEHVPGGYDNVPRNAAILTGQQWAGQAQDDTAISKAVALSAGGSLRVQSVTSGAASGIVRKPSVPPRLLKTRGYDNMDEFHGDKAPDSKLVTPPKLPARPPKRAKAPLGKRSTFIVTEPQLNFARPLIETSPSSPSEPDPQFEELTEMLRSDSSKDHLDFMRDGFSQGFSLPATPRITESDSFIKSAITKGDSPGGGLPPSFDDGFDAALAALSSLDIATSREMSRSTELNPSNSVNRNNASELLHPGDLTTSMDDSSTHGDSHAPAKPPLLSTHSQKLRPAPLPPGGQSGSTLPLPPKPKTAPIPLSPVSRFLRPEPGRSSAGRAPLATPESVHLGGSEMDVRSTTATDRRSGHELTPQSSPQTPTPDFSPPSAWDSQSKIFSQIASVNGGTPPGVENKTVSTSLTDESPTDLNLSLKEKSRSLAISNTESQVGSSLCSECGHLNGCTCSDCSTCGQGVSREPSFDPETPVFLMADLDGEKEKTAMSGRFPNFSVRHSRTKHQMSRITDISKNGKTELYNFLQSNGLDYLHKVLVESGFDSLNFLLYHVTIQRLLGLDESGAIGLTQQDRLRFDSVVAQLPPLPQSALATNHSNVSEWLSSLRLQRYQPAFHGWELAQLTDEVDSRTLLVDFGVSLLGHRHRILWSLTGELDTPNLTVENGDTVGVLVEFDDETPNQSCPAVAPADEFRAYYLGTTLVPNYEGTESTSAGMQLLKEKYKIDDADDGPQKMPEIKFVISHTGVELINAVSKQEITSHVISDVICVVQDGEGAMNCFAYIVRDAGRYFCHVFKVENKEMAEKIILTLQDAFEVAYNIQLAHNPQ